MVPFPPPNARSKRQDEMLEPNITVITGPKPSKHVRASPMLYNARGEGSKQGSTNCSFSMPCIGGSGVQLRQWRQLHLLLSSRHFLLAIAGTLGR